MPKFKDYFKSELSSPLADKFGRILFGNLQVVPDETLDAHSTEGYKLYTNMLRKDAQLARCFRDRAHIVMAQDYNILPGPGDPQDKKEYGKFITSVFEEIKNFRISRAKFFKAIAYGFQPAEIIFTVRPDGYYGIKNFCNRDPERFRFDKENNLILVGSGGMGLGGDPMPAQKFLVNTWGSDETPYGEGLLRELYPLWFFKSNGLKELIRFIEKFGTPFLFARYPRGISKEEQTALLDILKAMHGSSVGIGPNGTEFQISDMNRQGVLDLFKFLIDEYVDRQYSKAINGQTLSTESQSGTFALAKFQSKSQQHICEDDAQWQQEQLDEVIRTEIDINFGPQPQELYPHFRIPFEEEKDIVAYLRGISMAVNDLGLPVGENWLRDQIGIPEPAEDELVLEGRKQPEIGPQGTWPTDEGEKNTESE